MNPRQDIPAELLDEWVKQAQEQKATHLMIIGDNFGNKEQLPYSPKYVFEGQDAKRVAALNYGYPSRRANQYLAACINMKKDVEAQLIRRKVYNF